MWAFGRSNSCQDSQGDSCLMKERLDIILVNNGYAPSRDKAKRIIMAGQVFINGERADKAGTKYDLDSEIIVKGDQCPYVGRGGLKLEKAIKVFDLNLTKFSCMDMGASTGGFTDCMLQHGASKVYSVDVGYGQLDYKLRVDSRVINLEKTNIRYMDTSIVTEPLDLISIDVSFISTKHMFPVADKILSQEGIVISLIKPQFEAGKEQVGKGGIVREIATHLDVIKKVIGYAEENNLYPRGLTYSPIKGTKGNIEYLVYLTRNKSDCILVASDDEDFVFNSVEKAIDKTVALSHDSLDR